MSGYLSNTQTGERQFKVRGPFGAPLLQNSSMLSVHYDTIYFFGGGSGITPALQMVQHLYLTKNVRQQASQPYQASLTDELDVVTGDAVVVQHHFLDGWCFGRNERTGLMGSFPVACLFPRAAMRFVLMNVSDLDSDIMGGEIMQGAQLSYPHLVKIERFNSTTLTAASVGPHLETPMNSLVIICGPSGMSSRVVDMLEEMRFDATIKILGSNTFL